MLNHINSMLKGISKWGIPTVKAQLPVALETARMPFQRARIVKDLPFTQHIKTRGKDRLETRSSAREFIIQGLKKSE